MLHTMASPDVQPSRGSTDPLLVHSVAMIRNQPEGEWSIIDEARSRSFVYPKKDEQATLLCANVRARVAEASC
jgi:hypothetical protein